MALTAASTGQREITRAALIGALGIVYGDIGTSPLYAFKETLATAKTIGEMTPIVYGSLSLIFWSLIVVVSLKYVVVVMRATNDGEGGIMALTALASQALNSRWREIVILIGLVGTALFYGDCIITPAISVLSAVEGLEVATPVFRPYIVPIAVVVLAALFIVQRNGTAQIGKAFGPIMVLWFAVLGGLGLYHVVQNPGVLHAINPAYGLDIIVNHGWTGFHVLGSVFLAVTGAEALYADQGHFKGSVIRFDWLSFVLPALALNYFGQGALILSNPDAASNPFYLMFPDWALYPAVALATAATVIASQAVISGAFTITQQAMLLGFLPRMEVKHTSTTEAGQIYIPQANGIMAVLVLILVVSFKSSANLASAYGLAVSTTMLATTLLVGVVAIRVWDWSWPVTLAVVTFFLVVDAAFFSANAAKILDGGYVPLLAGVVMYVLMTVWREGRQILLARITNEALPLEAFWEKLKCGTMPRVPGTAIYLTSNLNKIPASLMLNVKHNKVLHEHVVLLKVDAERTARYPKQKRITVETLDHGFFNVTIRYGFAETPNVPRSLQRAIKRGVQLGFDLNGKGVSYFVGRAIPISSDRTDLSGWRESVFMFLTRNSASASNFFCIPPEQVVELGTHVEI
jgi:KUP system potassium uptake protein